MKVECTKCKKEIERFPSDLKRSPNSFCSRSCSNSFHNKLNPKRKKSKKCKGCEFLIKSWSTYCQNCKEKRKADNENLTIGYYKSKSKDMNRYRYIRDHANKKVQNRSQICYKCGYGFHVEVCHLTPIKSFSEETTIGVVNSDSNLILLCPNCHWEFDNGHWKYNGPIA